MLLCEHRGMPALRTNACRAIVAASCVVCGVAGAAMAEALASVPTAPVASVSREVSLDEYRQHLQALVPAVEACAKARDTKTCDPMLVGPDDRVALDNDAHAERRVVRYEWLRALLLRAQLSDAPLPKPSEALPGLPDFSKAAIAEPTTSQLLKDAVTRLNGDPARIGDTGAAPPAHGDERKILKNVLARREFGGLGDSSMRDTLLEKLSDAINRFFNALASFSARSPWIGSLVFWGFMASVCAGLIWGLLQLERRWRVRLAPEQAEIAAAAPSARDWQLWLDDAQRAARERRWREAVRLVYWAAISRLESKRLWPADRARTPREYLALVAEQDPRRVGLDRLTRSFERFWYGGRAANEDDYLAAEELAEDLIAGGGGAG
jgi:hypothetical protein